MVVLFDRLVQTNKNIVARARKTVTTANALAARLRKALRFARGKQRTSLSKQLNQATSAAQKAQGQVSQYSANATSAAGDAAAAMSNRDTAWIGLKSLQNEYGAVWGTKPQVAAATATTAAAGAADTTQLNLMTQLATQAAQRAAVSEAQLRAVQIPFGGSFAGGGIVPGPLGSPVAIVAHGGEAVGQPAGVDVQVHHHYAPGMEWLRDFVRTEVVKTNRTQTRPAMRGLPGSR